MSISVSEPQGGIPSVIKDGINQELERIRKIPDPEERERAVDGFMRMRVRVPAKLPAEEGEPEGPKGPAEIEIPMRVAITIKAGMVIGAYSDDDEKKYYRYIVKETGIDRIELKDENEYNTLTRSLIIAGDKLSKADKKVFAKNKQGETIIIAGSRDYVDEMKEDRLNKLGAGVVLINHNLGEGVEVGEGIILIDGKTNDNTKIGKYSKIESSILTGSYGDYCSIKMAVLGKGTNVGNSVTIENVKLKNLTTENGSYITSSSKMGYSNFVL